MRILGAILILLSTGCAQYMAIAQPGDVRTSKLHLGADRIVVINTLGQPSSTKEGDGWLKEFYTYTDGGMVNRPGFKMVRVLVYTAGDIFLFFLTQLVWMPTELFLAGETETVKVTYEDIDGDWRVSAIRSASSVQ